MPEENSKPNQQTDELELLLAARPALEKLHAELKKTCFTFSGAPDIEIVGHGSGYALRCTLTVKIPLQLSPPVYGGTPTNPDGDSSSSSPTNRR